MDLNNVLYAMKQSDDGPEIDFEFSDGKCSRARHFVSPANSYQSQITTEVTTAGVPFRT